MKHLWQETGSLRVHNGVVERKGIVVEVVHILISSGLGSVHVGETILLANLFYYVFCQKLYLLFINTKLNLSCSILLLKLT